MEEEDWRLKVIKEANSNDELMKKTLKGLKEFREGR